jgi:hypothetical protein
MKSVWILKVVLLKRLHSEGIGSHYRVILHVNVPKASIVGCFDLLLQLLVVH